MKTFNLIIFSLFISAFSQQATAKHSEKARIQKRSFLSGAWLKKMTEWLQEGMQKEIHARYEF